MPRVRSRTRHQDVKGMSGRRLPIDGKFLGERDDVLAANLVVRHAGNHQLLVVLKTCALVSPEGADAVRQVPVYNIAKSDARLPGLLNLARRQKNFILVGHPCGSGGAAFERFRF